MSLGHFNISVESSEFRNSNVGGKKSQINDKTVFNECPGLCQYRLGTFISKNIKLHIMNISDGSKPRPGPGSSFR